MQKSIAIICTGWLAPDINTVISTVAKIFLKESYSVIGVQNGYQGLFSAASNINFFGFHYVDRIFTRSGSTLIMSRFKPKSTDFNTTFLDCVIADQLGAI